MQIIVLHPRFSARSIALGPKHIGIMAMIFVACVLIVATLLYYVTMRYAAAINLPLVQEIVASAALDEANKKEKYVRENLTAMAMKLGEMQAQLVRLDALGERVQGLAGIKPEEFNFREKPGRGGPQPASAGVHAAHELSMAEFQHALDTLATDVEYRSDYMNVVESVLTGAKVRARLLPTVQPVKTSYNASGFGWRVDPFSGRNAFHEGIDFAAPVGTPIVAAAGGVVIAAEYHPEFGNKLEINHGNDIVTRYAHASKLLVRVGDIVRRGQHVADIGSTGRSTGPHLHFEVLVKGAQQNPHKFLSAGGDRVRLAALTSGAR
jgi:murein DD-endopeptidase MepM/ murein hydrolase activator NlpD